MKYVIDIDEYTYREANTHGGNSGKLVTAVRHGKPLDTVLSEIRAEIEDWQTNIHDNECDAKDHDFVFERIFEIIDECKSESEDKG